MARVTLAVVLKEDRLPTPAQRKKAINAAGGLSFPVGTPTAQMVRAASQLSKLSWVQRVVVTKIVETHVGTWRNGKRKPT